MKTLDKPIAVRNDFSIDDGLIRQTTLRTCVD